MDDAPFGIGWQANSIIRGHLPLEYPTDNSHQAFKWLYDLADVPFGNCATQRYAAQNPCEHVLRYIACLSNQIEPRKPSQQVRLYFGIAEVFCRLGPGGGDDAGVGYSGGRGNREVHLDATGRHERGRSGEEGRHHGGTAVTGHVGWETGVVCRH